MKLFNKVIFWIFINIIEVLFLKSNYYKIVKVQGKYEYKNMQW